MWDSGVITNFDYLLMLNFFGGRSLTDLTQYPIFPWIISPNLELKRDLSLPIGQLFKEKSDYYDEIYESTEEPKYYYGFHYSLPGIIFWFMIRLQPFTFLSWDLNNGWDSSKRLFVSIEDAYDSATKNNTSDLKELIPELYIFPEIFKNVSNLKFPNNFKENVELPIWSNDSPRFYVDVMIKYLQSTENIEEWIDLIFGYKELGDAALEYKNVFHPVCYQYSTQESLGMDSDAFKAQVIHFGQCPIQLFTKPHAKRSKQFIQPPKKIEISVQQESLIHGENSDGNVAKCDLGVYLMPKLSAPIPPKYDHFATVNSESETFSIQKVSLTGFSELFVDVDSKYSRVTDISVCSTGMFMAISFETGMASVYRIIYKNGDPCGIELTNSFYGSTKCNFTVVFAFDFVCASLFENSLVIWNYATQLLHHNINLGFNPKGIFCDDFSGVITIFNDQEIVQYSINGEKIREFQTDYSIEKAGLLPVTNSFDGRFIVIADIRGDLSFYSIDPTSYDPILICTKPIYIPGILSLFINPSTFEVITSDTFQKVFVSRFSNAEDFEEEVCQLDE